MQTLAQYKHFYARLPLDIMLEGCSFKIKDFVAISLIWIWSGDNMVIIFFWHGFMHARPRLGRTLITEAKVPLII
jgi:hypothetical protein